MRLLVPLFLFTLFAFIGYGFALDCIQCGNNEAWYSEEEHERRIEACRQGLIPPSPCHNSSHTHCIVNWYRTGGSSEKIVTQRQCGIESDVSGCTLYNSKISKKVRRHLINRDDSSLGRKESVTTFVEVCSTSCPHGECVNSAITSTTTTILVSTIFTYLVMRN